MDGVVDRNGQLVVITQDVMPNGEVKKQEFSVQRYSELVKNMNRNMTPELRRLVNNVIVDAARPMVQQGDNESKAFAVSGLNALFGATKQKTDQLSGQIDNTEKKVNDLFTATDEYVKQRTNYLNSRIDDEKQKINRQINSLSQRIDQDKQELSVKIKEIEDELQKPDPNIAKLKKLEDDIDTTRRKLNKNEGDLAELTVAVTNLEKKQKKDIEDVNAELVKQKEDYKERLKNLEQSNEELFTGVNKRLSDLTGQTKEFVSKDELKKLNNQVSVLNDDRDTIIKRVNNHEGRMKDFLTRDEGTNWIGEVEELLKLEIESKADEAGENLKQMEKKIDEKYISRGEHMGDIEDVRDNLHNVQGDLNEVKETLKQKKKNEKKKEKELKDDIFAKANKTFVQQADFKELNEDVIGFRKQYEKDNEKAKVARDELKKDLEGVQGMITQTFNDVTTSVNTQLGDYRTHLNANIKDLNTLQNNLLDFRQEYENQEKKRLKQEEDAAKKAEAENKKRVAEAAKWKLTKHKQKEDIDALRQLIIDDEKNKKNLFKASNAQMKEFESRQKDYDKSISEITKNLEKLQKNMSENKKKGGGGGGGDDGGGNDDGSFDSFWKGAGGGDDSTPPKPKRKVRRKVEYEDETIVIPRKKTKTTSGGTSGSAGSSKIEFNPVINVAPTVSVEPTFEPRFEPQFNPRFKNSKQPPKSRSNLFSSGKGMDIFSDPGAYASRRPVASSSSGGGGGNIRPIAKAGRGGRTMYQCPRCHSITTAAGHSQSVCDNVIAKKNSNKGGGRRKKLRIPKKVTGKRKRAGKSGDKKSKIKKIFKSYGKTLSKLERL